MNLTIYRNFVFLIAYFPCFLSARTLHIGSDQPYSNLESAARVVQAGDTILFHAGIYPGNQYIEALKGRESGWIHITSVPGDCVVIRGGTNAWQLSDPAFVSISNIIFEQQTGNGVNIDDGGDYSTPAHHVNFSQCTFRDMNASGNNDLLKLSGVDSFFVENCYFLNGAAGGSGIDMVGCHNGVIQGGQFRNMGSNAIQAKGGSENVIIFQNFFEDCGARTLNLGGSTGLAFFRPMNATFEAAHLYVYSNIFSGSDAPVAFVGCVNSEVVNNTIYKPQTWAVRILQETVDPDRFAECGDNSFRNNIIYLGNIRTETNVGPDTRPETFIFDYNFWFNYENENWRIPNTPVSDPHVVAGQDPLFQDASARDFRLQPSSPAIGQVSTNNPPEFDFYGTAFSNPRSIGAVEGNPDPTSIKMPVGLKETTFALHGIYPNPFNTAIAISFSVFKSTHVLLEIVNTLGQQIASLLNCEMKPGIYHIKWDAQEHPSGIYFYRIKTDGFQKTGKIILQR